ncbi:hypothetical protein [Streptomyces sp. CA2R106]|uniref:hypothetical protein n=1 Tax=Streptomyces sp. CA2R106 TaxID=3120153 RepID=UPI0030094041
MSSTDYAAQKLQSQADTWAADLAKQDPPASGGDLAWQQDMIRDAYTDAAHLTDQPGRH